MCVCVRVCACVCVCVCVHASVLNKVHQRVDLQLGEANFADLDMI